MTDDASAITASAKSNLALAFFCLPKDRRADMAILYAYCRLVDDIADDPGWEMAERQRRLTAWRAALVAPVPDESPVAASLREMAARREIATSVLTEILDGVEMDLFPVRYETVEALRAYCYRVASAVGLASIKIFGCCDPACQEYAIQLGYALQWTNILRDVGKDFGNGGRIYLPQEEMVRFGITEADIARGDAKKLHPLLESEAARAAEFYANAIGIRDRLSSTDRHALRSAEIMREVYSSLLRKLRRERFPVFGQECRLSRLEKIGAIWRGWSGKK